MTVKAVHTCDRCGLEERTDIDKAAPNFWAIQQFQFPNWPNAGGHKMLCAQCLAELRDWLTYAPLYQVVRVPEAP